MINEDLAKILDADSKTNYVYDGKDHRSVFVRRDGKVFLVRLSSESVYIRIPVTHEIDGVIVGLEKYRIWGEFSDLTTRTIGKKEILRNPISGSF